MNTAKDLLVSTLTANGFIYYPSMKRLMLKNEDNCKSEVLVVEMNDEKQCRVYFNYSNSQMALNNQVDDQKFSYNTQTILNHIFQLLSDEKMDYKTAA